MAVTKRLRYEILRRDNHTCRYCGASAPDVKLTIDHVLPVALGGQDDPANLVAACKDCNAGKTSTTPGAPLVDDVTSASILWARAMEKVAVERARARSTRDFMRQSVHSLWTDWKWTDEDGVRHALELPADWELSVDRFFAAGIEYEDFIELIATAMKCRTTTNKWKYFCGCAWTRIRENQDRAGQLIAEGAVPDGR